MTMDIRDLSHLLTPYGKLRNHYHCEVCGGKLWINPRNGHFSCVTGGCKGIIKAILKRDPATLEEREKRRKEREDRQSQSKVNFAQNTAENLNIFYRSLFKNPNNQLSKDDLKALKSRGFDTESVKDFVSIKKGYNYVPANVPALSFIKIDNKYSHGEKYFYSSHSGILFLTKDSNGNYIGGQIWNFNKEKKDDPKYFPIANSHVYFPNIKEKETPLYTFIPEVYDNNSTNTFLLTEGILKSHLASILHDMPVIGASGGNFKPCKHQLKIMIERYKFNSAIVAIDAGDPTNPQRIKHWKNQFKMFKSLGINISIFWYDQYQKGERGDIDEINLSEINYQLISEKEFFEKAKNYKEKGKRQWKDSRKLTSDIKINKKHFSFTKDDLKGLDGEIKSFFDNELMVKQNKVLAIKSPLGSGKTTFIINSILKILNNRNEKVIFPACRRALNTQTQGKINSTIDPSIDDNYQDHYIYILNDSKVLPVDREGNLLHLMLCIDSFEKLESHLEDIKDMTIIIDEICSVVYHLLFSNTLSKNRSEVIALFKTILSNCKRIIVLDANLTDCAVDFISAISNKESIVIENTFKKAQKAILNILQFELTKNGDIKKKYFTSIIQQIFNCLENNQKIVLTIDSITTGEAIERAIVALFPNIKILNVNAKTKGDENRIIERFDVATGKKIFYNEVELFCNNPDDYIKENQIDVLIYNSTIESGIDISINNYFSDQFIIIHGVLIVDSVLQIIKRIRDDKVQRHLWTAERGLFANNSYASFLENQTKKNIDFLNSNRAKKLEQLLNDLVNNCNLTNDQKKELSSETCRKIFTEMTTPLFDKIIDDLRTKFLSFLKYEASYYKECLIERLGIDYEINLIYAEVNEEIKKAQKAINQQLKEEKATAILESDYIPDDYDKNKLENLETPYKRLAPSPEKPDQVGIDNFYLRQQLPNIKLTKELILKLKSNGQLMTQIDNYFLFNHPNILDVVKGKSLISSAKKKQSITDIKLNLDFVELMYKANLKAIIELGIYHNDSPELINFVDNLLNNKSLVRELNKYDSLAIKSLKGKDRAKGIGCLLARLGYMTKAKKITINGGRINTYEIVNPDQDEIRNLILQGRSNYFNSEKGGIIETIEKMVKKEGKKSPENLTQQGAEGCPHPNSVIINNTKMQGCGHPQSLIYQEVKPSQEAKNNTFSSAPVPKINEKAINNLCESLVYPERLDIFNLLMAIQDFIHQWKINFDLDIFFWADQPPVKLFNLCNHLESLAI